MTKKQARQLLLDSLGENGLDKEKLKDAATLHHWVEPDRSEVFFAALSNIEKNIESDLKDSRWQHLAENALFPGTKVGVLSLTEKRDNKPMWSLYGGQYSGYCIEYEIPHTEEIVTSLYPVIYTKRANNRLIEKLLEYWLAVLTSGISSGRIQGNAGATIELFCTKDSDWSYQSEWRIVGRAKENYRNLPIKAIYLGYNVKRHNEQRMRVVAQKHGFLLFKMNRPNGTKRITYTKLV